MASAAIFMVPSLEGPVERWRTTTVYGGSDKVSTVPPHGGTATTVLSDGLGRPIEKREYFDPANVGSNDAATFQATKYTYTRANQIATVTDPGRAKWPFGYDMAGNRVRSIDPDAGIATATYNAAGQLVSTTDARGASLHFSYDAPVARRLSRTAQRRVRS